MDRILRNLRGVVFGVDRSVLTDLGLDLMHPKIYDS